MSEIDRFNSRFFARIRAGIIECPRCSTMYELTPVKRAGMSLLPSRRWWDSLTGRFHCSRCGWVAILGVTAWELDPSIFPPMPHDWKPTPIQAAWMRDLGRGMWQGVDQGKRTSGVVESVNRVIGHQATAEELRKIVGVEVPDDIGVWKLFHQGREGKDK